MAISELKVNEIKDTIASGTTSAELDIQGGTLVGIVIPASIASTTFTITAALASGGTFLTVKDPLTNSAYTGNVTQSGWYFIDPAVTAGLRYIKIVYSDSETTKAYSYVLRSFD